MGEMIYFRRVTVRDKAGKVFGEWEQQVLQDGRKPQIALSYESKGIV